MSNIPSHRPHFSAFWDDWGSSSGWEDHHPAHNTSSHVAPYPDLFDELIDTATLPRKKYSQGSTIDWLREEASERALQEELRSLRGVPRLLLSLKEVLQLLFIVVTTGAGVGIVGAELDVLVHWLSDLRIGRCGYGFMYNEIACCSGLDPGEICNQWKTWSEWFGIKSLAGQSLLQSFAYIVLAVAYAASACILVQYYAPYAFHTGIPEIKAILNGYVLDAFLGPWTLLIKALGLALSVSSGLSLGKEGPMVHVSCCMAALSARLFPSFGKSELRKRLVLSAAAAAGVSVAFGSPLGGIMFGLEELDLFSNEHLIWTAFVTSVIASVSLQYMDPFGTGKLVLFQISAGTTSWRAFELIPWFALGVVGGVLGSIFIRLNVRAAVHRHRSVLKDWPLIEVIGVTTVTAIISFLVPFMKVQTSSLVANLFKDCDANLDYYGLCNTSAVWSTVFLLVTTAGFKFLLTAWTFGINVPAGIFLPSLAIGASLGRAIGILLQSWHRSHPTAWIFGACPPEGACISPGFYAVTGAAAVLTGVTRMTISIVVILFELTGALSHVLPIMISVMTAKWVADSLSSEGIYTAWIALHDYPFLPTSEFHDKGETAADFMVPRTDLITINGRGTSLRVLSSYANSLDHDGYPVIDDEMLVGFVTREAVQRAISPLLTNISAEGEGADPDVIMCSFIPSQTGTIDLSSSLERTSMRLRKETPLQVVVHLFQTLNIPFVLFTSLGKLAGLMTRRDVIRLLSPGFEFTGALVDEELKRTRT